MKPYQTIRRIAAVAMLLTSAKVMAMGSKYSLAQQKAFNACERSPSCAVADPYAKQLAPNSQVLILHYFGTAENVIDGKVVVGVHGTTFQTSGKYAGYKATYGADNKYLVKDQSKFESKIGSFKRANAELLVIAALSKGVNKSTMNMVATIVQTDKFGKVSKVLHQEKLADVVIRSNYPFYKGGPIQIIPSTMSGLENGKSIDEILYPMGFYMEITGHDLGETG
jgi:hypothetical protein